jgi:hypothetical protein
MKGTKLEEYSVIKVNFAPSIESDGHAITGGTILGLKR